MNATAERKTRAEARVKFVYSLIRIHGPLNMKAIEGLLPDWDPIVVTAALAELERSGQLQTGMDDGLRYWWIQ